MRLRGRSQILVGENCNIRIPRYNILFFFLDVVRRLGELVFKLAEYGRGFVSEFTAGLDDFMSGLGESTLFNETLISWVWDLFKVP